MLQFGGIAGYECSLRCSVSMLLQLATPERSVTGVNDNVTASVGRTQQNVGQKPAKGLFGGLIINVFFEIVDVFF
jgi:hypothetical protein